MTDKKDSRNADNVREIAPFKPVTANPEHTFEDMAIAADTLDDMLYAALMLLSENTNHSQEQRAAVTILGAAQIQVTSLKQCCAQ